MSSRTRIGLAALTAWMLATTTTGSVSSSQCITGSQVASPVTSDIKHDGGTGSLTPGSSRLAIR